MASHLSSVLARRVLDYLDNRRCRISTWAEDGRSVAGHRPSRSEHRNTEWAATLTSGRCHRCHPRGPRPRTSAASSADGASLVGPNPRSSRPALLQASAHPRLKLTFFTENDMVSQKPDGKPLHSSRNPGRRAWHRRSYPSSCEYPWRHLSRERAASLL